MLKESLARAAAAIAASSLPVAGLDVEDGNDRPQPRQKPVRRARSRSARDKDVAKYRHFMITSSGLEILRHNRALVKRREAELRSGNRLQQRRLEQLRRGT